MIGHLSILAEHICPDKMPCTLKYYALGLVRGMARIDKKDISCIAVGALYKKKKREKSKAIKEK
jgi:hypothetical protein